MDTKKSTTSQDQPVVKDHYKITALQHKVNILARPTPSITELVSTLKLDTYVSYLNIQYLCHAVLCDQSCLTLCDPTDSSPPDSTVHGILQARILEWVAISFSICHANKLLNKVASILLYTMNSFGLKSLTSSVQLVSNLFVPQKSCILLLQEEQENVLGKQISFDSFIFWPCHMACRSLVPQPGTEPLPSALEAKCRNHWANREVPKISFESIPYTWNVCLPSE